MCNGKNIYSSTVVVKIAQSETGTHKCLFHGFLLNQEEVQRVTECKSAYFFLLPLQKHLEEMVPHVTDSHHLIMKLTYELSFLNTVDVTVCGFTSTIKYAVRNQSGNKISIFMIL